MLSHLSLFNLPHNNLRLIRYGFNSILMHLHHKLLSRHNHKLLVLTLASQCILSLIFRRILNMLNHLLNMPNHLLLNTLNLNQEDPLSKTKV